MYLCGTCLVLEVLSTVLEGRKTAHCAGGSGCVEEVYPDTLIRLSGSRKLTHRINNMLAVADEALNSIFRLLEIWMRDGT